jgi:RNA polymerase sigma factor (sigma-70 family)
MTTPRADADSSPSTERLVRRSQAGEGDEFGELFTHLTPSLFAWARVRIPDNLRSKLDPDDVVQEAWIRAYRSFDSYDEAKGSFRAWLFKVAKHSLLDMIRHARVRRSTDGRMAADASDPHLSRLVDDVTSVSRRLARDESLQAFLRRIRLLPEEERLLLVHCGLEGMQVKEAADRIGLSLAAAGKRWQRLRARLADEQWPAGLLEPI